MRKFLVFAVALSMAASCSKKEETSVSDENARRNAEMAQQNSAAEVSLSPAEEGRKLIEGADCLTCHKVNEKMIGPSYEEVAAKYEKTPENISLLAERIVKGSTGIWGTTPMTPHPGMSEENAKKMVEYVFSLKK